MRLTRIVLLPALFLALAAGVHAQRSDLATFKCMDCFFSIDLPEQWQKIDHPESVPGYELVLPDTTIHIVLRPLTTADTDVRTILRKIVKDRRFKMQQEIEEVSEQDLNYAWTVATGAINNKKMGALYIAGHTKTKYWLVSVEMPPNRLKQYSQTLQRIASSVKVL